MGEKAAPVVPALLSDDRIEPAASLCRGAARRGLCVVLRCALPCIDNDTIYQYIIITLSHIYIYVCRECREFPRAIAAARDVVDLLFIFFFSFVILHNDIIGEKKVKKK